MHPATFSHQTQPARTLERLYLQLFDHLVAAYHLVQAHPRSYPDPASVSSSTAVTERMICGQFTISAIVRKTACGLAATVLWSSICIGFAEPGTAILHTSAAEKRTLAASLDRVAECALTGINVAPRRIRVHACLMSVRSTLRIRIMEKRIERRCIQR